VSSLLEDAERVAKIINRYPSIAERKAVKAFQEIGQHHVATMQLRQKAVGSNKSGPGLSVRYRQGHLARSFGWDVNAGDGKAIVMRVFSAGVPYANIHEFGGTVKPAGGRKYLTIPIADNLRANGTPKFPSARRLMDDPSRDTFIFKSKRGNLLIAEPSITKGGKRRYVKGPNGEKKEKLKLLFALKPSVTIRPRLGWVRGWQDEKGWRDERLTKAFSNTWKDAQA
jgi:phage gpG-like protein